MHQSLCNLVSRRNYHSYYHHYLQIKNRAGDASREGSDLMWQVICSCFRFDQNTKRVTHYFTAPAFACLNKTAPPTIPQASIAPAYPQDGVITYTTVCSDSQAASNPIGLNLH